MSSDRRTALMRARTALQHWISDERAAAERRHPGAEDDVAMDDPEYQEALGAWDAADTALRDVLDRMHASADREVPETGESQIKET